MKLQFNTSTLRVSSRAGFRSGWPTIRLALIAALVLGVVGSAIAQDRAAPRAAPQKRDCNNLPQGDNESKGDKINAKLDCRSENVNVELSKLVDTASSSDLYSPSAKKALENARDHAQSARERTKKAGGFKGLARKQKSNCYVQEADSSLPGHEGNSDGICTTRGGNRETCAEVIGDGIGNDDGICESRGNPKEVCVEICDSALNDQDDDNFDDEAATEIEVAFMDLESALVDTNEVFAAGLKAYAEAKQLRQTNPAGGNDCLQDTLGLSTLVTMALAWGKSTAEYVFDACSSFCGNDVAGFNCKAGCYVPATAKYILGVLVNLNQTAEEFARKSGTEIQYSCQGETSNAVAAVDSAVATVDLKATSTEAKVTGIERKLDVTAGNVDAIQQKVDALSTRVDEVLILLNTPQGRRPDFPR